jgi:Mg2+ and Co2+ transporter CorA
MERAGDDARLRVRRFDADRRDEVLSLDDAIAQKPSDRQLLWIDITDALDEAEVRRLAEAFELDASTQRAFETPDEYPHLAVHGRYLHVRIAVEPNDQRPSQTPWLDVIGATNVVITHHRAPIRFLEDIDERIEADTTFGMLDAGTFMSALLGAAVTTYFEAVDAIEDEVDRLDSKSLRDDGRHHLLEDLVLLRRRIARLRRVLTNHRQVFTALASAETTTAIENPDIRPAFETVASRFDAAIGAVEDSRDVLLGSFDVYMTRTAQRTNDVMKVLALATVLLLPGSLVAGLLGMNVVVPLSKDDPMSFWFVLAGVGIFAILILVVARLRRWL